MRRHRITRPVFATIRGSKSKKSEDYYTETNWDIFLDWCERVVFPRIAATNKSSVVVLDRATQHIVIVEEDRSPVTSWNKARLIDPISHWEGLQTNGLLHGRRKNPSTSYWTSRAVYSSHLSIIFRRQRKSLLLNPSTLRFFSFQQLIRSLIQSKWSGDLLREQFQHRT